MYCLDGFFVKNDRGYIIAELSGKGRSLKIRKTPACSIGEYFEILTYLYELGYFVSDEVSTQ